MLPETGRNAAIGVELEAVEHEIPKADRLWWGVGMAAAILFHMVEDKSRREGSGPVAQVDPKCRSRVVGPLCGFCFGVDLGTTFGATERGHLFAARPGVQVFLAVLDEAPDGVILRT